MHVCEHTYRGYYDVLLEEYILNGRLMRSIPSRYISLLTDDVWRVVGDRSKARDHDPGSVFRHSNEVSVRDGVIQLHNFPEIINCVDIFYSLKDIYLSRAKKLCLMRFAMIWATKTNIAKRFYFTQMQLFCILI